MLTFVAFKSISLVLNAARGVALAAILGPEAYGVFGTLIVIQQYLSYLALGMREGVAISLARSGRSESHEASVYSSSLTWAAGSGVIAIALLACAGAVSSMNREHLMLVGLISAFSIVNEIFVNINRHENRLRKIAFVEIAYNAVVVAGIAIFWQQLTVSLALLANAVGIVVSVSVYAATIQRVRVGAVSRMMVMELVRIGFLPGVFSALLVVLGSFYIVAANVMETGDTIGLVVFGNNIGALLLFGLNTVSWALASRSMSRLFAPALHDGSPQTATADAFFRFGIVGVIVVALGAQLLFTVVMRQYAGAEIYVLYYCLFQSYGLLLFSETSFANVNGATRQVMVGYLLLAATFAVACVVFDGNFTALLEFSVVAHFALALWIVLYCRRLGFNGGALVVRVAVLMFPVLCAFAYRGGSHVVLAACAIAFLALVLVDGGKVAGAVAARRPIGRRPGV